MTISQGTNGLGPATLNSSDRLRKIDLLRENNIGTHLPLPQLVAVGDQSSGKSSLLESLTGIPFPRDQNLCTRYATQITHRREDISHINISIIPGPNACDEDKARLSGYAREVQSTAELHAEFSMILDEVNKLMDIRTARNPAGSKTFTRDVLKIEKCGPDEDYLTIIDVPGIFQLVEEGVVTTNDKRLVRKMVEKYIKDSRTVILAVLPSTSDVFTQEILALAEEHDKKGERTLGILTKPDLLKENRAKASICDMVNGKRKPLNLGYYVVRNKGADDGNDLDLLGDHLAERERIFQDEPWSSLPKDRVGVNALRERLQDLLGQITDRCFPLVRMETRQMLVESQKARDELGDPRQTEREQQKYLATIAGKFQALARTGLDADYYIDQAFQNSEFRLITSVINLTENFARGFMQVSSLYSFQKDGTEPVPVPPSATFTTLDINDPDLDTLNEFPELEGILSTDWSFHPPKDGLIPWIDAMYRRSRGIDLFTYSASLPASAFREQSAKWRLMTEQYLSQIIFVLHRFIMGVLDLVCKDRQVFEQVKSSIVDDLLVRYREGMEQAMFLVGVEREKKPYTLNQTFYGLVDDSRRDRAYNAARAKRRLSVQTELSRTDSPLVVEEQKDNKERIKEDIHDKLEAYYEVASKRFLDNVFRQAVDHCLLSGPRSPLLVFSEQWVIGLSKEKLAGIAGEPRMARERRESLDRKIVDLEGAIKILQ